mmetsp:Transcript_20092/g.54119  ORF Transcript_20092/g.54119 Transcript_20092/m.54119 type:complete len:299 (-) Transcript_20092:22-918(-)
MDKAPAPRAACAWGGGAPSAPPKQPLPAQAAMQCAMCGAAGATTRMQPCGHVACAACVGQVRRQAILSAEKGARCPRCHVSVHAYGGLNDPSPPQQQATRAQAGGSRGGAAADPGQETAQSRSKNRGGAGGRNGADSAANGSGGGGARGGGDAGAGGRRDGGSGGGGGREEVPVPDKKDRISAGVPPKLADAEKNAEPWMYKTKMCKRWQTTGTCSYGDNCWFVSDEATRVHEGGRASNACTREGRSRTRAAHRVTLRVQAGPRVRVPARAFAAPAHSAPGTTFLSPLQGGVAGSGSD